MWLSEFGVYATERTNSSLSSIFLDIPLLLPYILILFTKQILETLRIGNIAEQDRGSLPPIADPYILDPEREEGLDVRRKKR